jgi:hypothetical protein
MLEFVFRLSQLSDSQADFYRQYEGRHDLFESHRGAFERRPAIIAAILDAAPMLGLYFRLVATSCQIIASLPVWINPGGTGFTKQRRSTS